MRINGVGVKFTILLRLALRNRIVNFTPTPFILLLVLSCHAVASESTPPDGFWTSDRFQVSFESDLKPIVINQIHQWIIQVQTLDGAPVTKAEISIDGGMPDHDHGLPTDPQVTGNLGDGRYRVEGLRFHMQGQWELKITIRVDNKEDVVTIFLEL